MLGEKWMIKKASRLPQRNERFIMSVWSEEKLRQWTYERQSGMQQRSDWINYPPPNPPMDWMRECGCSQCKRRKPCTWARVSMACHGIRSCYIRNIPTKFDWPHYKVRGCNIQSRSEWVQYLPIRVERYPGT